MEIFLASVPGCCSSPKHLVFTFSALPTAFLLNIHFHLLTKCHHPHFRQRYDHLRMENWLQVEGYWGGWSGAQMKVLLHLMSRPASPAGCQDRRWKAAGLLVPIPCPAPATDYCWLGDLEGCPWAALGGSGLGSSLRPTTLSLCALGQV